MKSNKEKEMDRKVAVVVVDVQGDFTIWKDGPLGVPGSDRAYVKDVEVAVNELKAKGLDIYGTQDAHPEDHLFFNTSHIGKEPYEVIDIFGREQILWPPHCVLGTKGADILIDNTLFKRVVRKGYFRDWDSWSGFYIAKDGEWNVETPLRNALDDAMVDEIIVFGLTTDYCVKATALDAIKLGFNVTLIKDLCRGVDPKTTEEALEDMTKAGVRVVDEKTFQREIF